MNIKQNEVWMVRLGHSDSLGHEQRGTRPFFVVSNTEYNERSKTPVGFFMSTSRKKSKNRFSVEVSLCGKLEFVNVSQVRTLSDIRFIKKLGTCNDQDRAEIVSRFESQILS